MTEPITVIAAIAIGKWLTEYTASKVTDAVLEKIKESGIVDRAIEKTGEKHHASLRGEVEHFLTEWTNSPGFDRLLRKFADEGVSSEQRIVKHFTEATNYPGVNRVPAQEIVKEFLQNLDDELNNTDEGARLGRLIRKQHAELRKEHHERKNEHEAISKGVGSLNDKLDQLLAGESDLSEPLKVLLGEGLDNIHEAIAENKLPKALGLVDERLEKLSEFKSQHPETREIVEELRQHICLDAASIARWMGKSEAAETYWEKAKSIEISFLSANTIPAATAAFNIGKTKDLRRIVEHLDPDHEEHAKFSALLAFAEEDWGRAAELIPEDTDGVDLQLLRAQALIQELTEEGVPEIYSHLQFAAARADSSFLRRVLAHTSFRLLQVILRRRFPLPDFDRKRFVDQVRQWMTEAVQAYQLQGASKSGYARTLILANYVFDFFDEQETVSELQNELKNLEEDVKGRIRVGQVLDPDELKSLEDKGEITSVDRLYHEAIHFENNGPRERAVTKLRLALELTDNRDENELIVDKLISLLVSDDDLEAAETVLSKANELRSDLRQLLQVRLVRERQGEGAALQFLEEAANEIPGSQLILSNLTRNLVQSSRRLRAELGTKDEKAQEIAAKALDYAKRLIRVFPSPESYRQLAEANWLHGDVPAAIELIKQVRDRGYFPFHLRRILVQLYLDEKKVPSATKVLENAVEDYPEDWRVKNEAAALRGQYGDPDRAIELLESVKAERVESPYPYINLALAYRQRGDQAQDDYTKAVEALELALERAPSDLQIINLLYVTSRLAGMPRKSDQYFLQMMEAASRVEADSVDDVDEAFQREGGGLLQFGDTEILVEYIRRDWEAIQAADRLLENSLWSYGDRFRAQGRAWPIWFGWIEHFQKGWQDGNVSSPSIHAGWPTATDVLEREMMNQNDGRGILLDETSLLTLGVLKTGEGILRDLLNTGKELYLYPGALDRLQEEISDLAERMHLEGGRSYRRLAILLQDTNAVAPAEANTLDEIELPSQVKEDLGLEAFDIAVADRESGYYVTDIEDRAKVIPGTAISSRELLRTLHEMGLITASDAESIAEERPRTFGDWRKAEPKKLNKGDTIVFGRFSLLEWFESGLLEAAGGIDSRTGPSFKVGPWARSEIHKEARKIAIITSAKNDATDLSRTLLDLIDRQEIKELTSSSKTVSSLDEHVFSIWTHTINVLSAASDYNLNVWADDRFLSLVSKPFGLFFGDPRLQTEAQKLRESFENVAILSTEQMLMYLAEHDQKDLSTDPESIGWQLVELGYRPLLLRLGLRHLLQEYPYRRENPALPFQQLFQVLASINELPPEDAHPRRREVFSRLLSSSVFPGLILEAWRGMDDESIDVDVRQALASDLLEKFEDGFRQEGEEIDKFVGPLWRSVQGELARTDELTFEEKQIALRWLGEEATSSDREEHRSQIVRALEDDFLEAVSFFSKYAETQAKGGPAEGDDSAKLPAVFVGRYAILRIIPLVDTNLINQMDPLMRRIVGFVAGQSDGFLVPFTVSSEGLEQDIEIHEGEVEESALDVFKAGLAGNPQVSRMLYAGGLRFIITKSGSTAEGQEVYVPIEFDTSLFQLLLHDDKSVRAHLLDAFLQQLVNIDPDIATRFFELKPQILSEDSSEREAALKSAGLALLGSVFFQLQRDFGHGIKVLRSRSLSDIDAFTGRIEISSELAEEFDSLQIGGVLIGDDKIKQVYYTDLVRGLYVLSMDVTSAKLLIEGIRDECQKASKEDVLEAWKSSVEFVELRQNPLESAYSVFHALVMGEISNDVKSIAKEHREDMQQRIAEKLPILLSASPRFAEKPQGDEDILYYYQRVNHATAGRLAFHIIASNRHRKEALEKYNGDTEQAAEYLLDLVFRLQNQLLRVANGLCLASNPSETARSTSNLLEDAKGRLDIDIPPRQEQDIFNVTLYGPSCFDLWIASIMKVLALLLERSVQDGHKLPFWWSQDLEKVLRQWKTIPENKAEQMIREAREANVSSKIGIELKHNPQELAATLLGNAEKAS